ncbi:MAG: anti-sigma factor antagonist [Aphanocapsa feldmannii 277cV]|uniref:Anti-sigma factor antagonist n=2 Tax=Aphanocapsa feldmannii TaxID=192050 RepID=A0A524RM63_9CHRO|nr:MAG: anti-sigma factor antagonist [Aphanocapsa feldmannii 288cV]TGG90584.1 MAG: anti-sigma factor antagonist [Aphanocapsa feldmannii 277cV]TGH27570.1 MAG: anti-sigma factor antagonist [Aphanocapsa feldmannii 277cI]
MRFAGQLDAYSERQFEEFITRERDDRPLPLVLDLSRIDFIDSSGLGSLVKFAKACRTAAVPFQLVGNGRVNQTVKLVRLETFLNLQPSLDSAVGQLKLT